MKRILFITLSNIGDVIMTTPTLEAIHQNYPEAVIDVVGDARSEILFRRCPYLGNFYEKDKSKGLLGLIKLLWQLRKNSYELAFDLRSDGLLHFIRAKKKFTKLNHHAANQMHSVEKHFAALKLDSTEIPAPKIWLSDRDTRIANKLLSRHGRKRILAIGVGANFDGKIWPTQNFIALANRLNQEFDLVLLVGNQQDLELVTPFVPLSQLPIINTCGEYNLLETAALLSKVDYFVGNDSGLGHLASAVDIPSFTIFGIGQPHRYRPWGNKAAWIQQADNNINLISVDQVTHAIQSHLSLLRS